MYAATVLPGGRLVAAYTPLLQQHRSSWLVRSFDPKQAARDDASRNALISGAGHGR